MVDSFRQAVWELGIDHPEAQRAIADSITASDGDGNGYSVPIRKYCKATDRVEDVRTSYQDLEDPIQRKYWEADLEKVRELTVGELADRLEELSAFLKSKEAEGKKLLPVDKTLKDIDITMLALVAMMGA